MSIVTVALTESTAYPNPLKTKSFHWNGVMPISSMAALTSAIFLASTGSTRDES